MGGLERDLYMIVLCISNSFQDHTPTTRNIHFYDENVNDEFEIVIEERFL